MPSQPLSLNQRQKPRINVKYILIVAILAFLVGGGIIVYTKYTDQQIISLLEFLNIKKDGTADWQTYRNGEYGYEIKYPIGSRIEEIPSNLPEVPVEATVDIVIENVSIRINSWKNNEDYKTLEELIKGEKKKQNEGQFSVFPTIPDSYQEFQINGEPAIKWSTYNNEVGKIGAIMISLKGNYLYDITGSTIPEQGDYLAEFTDKEEKIYDLFISTFKFIE